MDFINISESNIISYISESDRKSMVNCEDKLYEGGKQYKSKADQWEAIKTTMSVIELAEVRN